MIWIIFYIIGCFLSSISVISHIKHKGKLTLLDVIFGIIVVLCSWCGFIGLVLANGDDIIIWKRKEAEK